MKPKRKFSKEFKRQVIEELNSKTSTLAQLSRRHNISSGLIKNWENLYAEGKLSDGPEENVDALKDQVAQLQKMIGRLTMENDVLKKAAQYSYQKQKSSSSVIISGNAADLEKSAK